MPELVHLIASFDNIKTPNHVLTAFWGDRSNLVRLSQVCWRTFEILAPEIWKSVYGMHHLLALIESASFQYDDLTGELEKVQILNDGDATDKLFKRFNLYAPYVETLDVYGKHHNGYVVLDWSALLALRGKSCSLLPNLKTIALLCRRLPAQGLEQITWITSLATLTTINVLISSYLWADRDELPFSMASEFLAALAIRCPTVESLTLHSCDDVSGTVDMSDRKENIPAQAWYQSIGVFQNLCHLSITEGWLDHASLLALCQLPRLENLEISPGNLRGFEVSHDLNSKLPSGAFSRLRILSLKYLHPYVVVKLLSIHQMVEPITRLWIHLDPEDLDENNHDGHLPGLWQNNWIVYELLPLLHAVACLTDLQMEFASSEKVAYQIGAPEVLDVMAKLPLWTVHLGHMHLGTGTLDSDLGTVWSKVTMLSMPSQYASLQELSYFAAIPNLQCLIVMVSFTTTFTPPNTLIRRSTLHTLQSSYGSRINTKFAVLEHNARMLARLWPNMRFTMASGRDKRWEHQVKKFNHLFRMCRAIEHNEVQEKKELAKEMLSAYRAQVEPRGTSTDCVYEG